MDACLRSLGGLWSHPEPTVACRMSSVEVVRRHPVDAVEFGIGTATDADYSERRKVELARGRY